MSIQSSMEWGISMTPIFNDCPLRIPVRVSSRHPHLSSRSEKPLVQFLPEPNNYRRTEAVPAVQNPHTETQNPQEECIPRNTCPSPQVTKNFSHGLSFRENKNMSPVGATLIRSSTAPTFSSERQVGNTSSTVSRTHSMSRPRSVTPPFNLRKQIRRLAMEGRRRCLIAFGEDPDKPLPRRLTVPAAHTQLPARVNRSESDVAKLGRSFSVAGERSKPGRLRRMTTRIMRSKSLNLECRS